VPGEARVARESPAIRRIRLRHIALAAGTLAVLLFVGVTARYLVWPDLEPLPARVDAIIELGGPGDRDAAALSLARSKLAPFLVQSTTVSEAGTNRCLPPVPEVTVLCFHAEPNTTRGEAQYIGLLAQQRHWSSIVLVTSTDQAERAILRVSRCFPGRIYVSTTPPRLLDWFVLVPYQWAAFAKALFLEPDC
jgi:uncharacterized SAM-binding protein YcdF (DUF218 family)